MVAEIGAERIAPDVAALRAAGFSLLLDGGQPIAIHDLAEAVDMPPSRVAELVNEVRARGRIEMDEDNRLIGIAGLTLTPGRHQLTVGRTTRWTWCALDAIGILAALAGIGTVSSADPQSGELIEISFKDGVPQTEAYLFVAGGFEEMNVREDWCPKVNLFSSREAADTWANERRTAGVVIRVADIAPVAAELWAPVVDATRDAPE